MSLSTHLINLAGRAGFEPAAEFNPDTHLAGEPNQPLWHLPVYEIGAEEVGFEPTLGCPKPVFKTGAFSRSATPPLRGMSLRVESEFYHISKSRQ